MSASSLNRAPEAGPGPVAGPMADEAAVTAAIRGRSAAAGSCSGWPASRRP